MPSPTELGDAGGDASEEFEYDLVIAVAAVLRRVYLSRSRSGDHDLTRTRICGRRSLRRGGTGRRAVS